MNKAELIDKVSLGSGLSKSDATRAVNATFDVISQGLASGDSVQLIGFGTFKVNDRPARQGRNPKTGETINIAATKQVKLVVGRALKDAVNK